MLAIIKEYEGCVVCYGDKRINLSKASQKQLKAILKALPNYQGIIEVNGESESPKEDVKLDNPELGESSEN